MKLILSYRLTTEASVCPYRVIDEQGQEIYRFHDQVSEVAQTVLDLLRIDCSAYGLS